MAALLQLYLLVREVMDVSRACAHASEENRAERHGVVGPFVSASRPFPGSPR